MFLLFLIALLINKVFSFWQIPFHDSHLNFSHFHEKIKHVIHRRELWDNDCSIPPGAIIVTLGNQHYFPLLKAQLHAMELYEGGQYCLSKSFVTLCLDKLCYISCLTNGLLNCALLDTGNIPASDGAGQHAYGYHNYLKTIYDDCDRLVAFFKRTTSIYWVCYLCLT